FGVCLGGSRASEPVSFFARIQGIHGRAAPPLFHVPTNGESQESPCRPRAVSHPDRPGARVQRNQRIHEHVSQARRDYADRLSPKPRVRSAATTKARAATAFYSPPWE